MRKNLLLKIISYFIIYSVIGYLMETMYGMVTKGVVESRKSFLYGPFCIVYGIAAICLIYPLQKYKNKNEELFVYGMVIGCLVEYFSSLIAELAFHIKWWDYSKDYLNLHGRTCIYYALIWGILSIALIDYIHPFLESKLENLIKKQKQIFKYITISISIFMLLDCLVTSIALNNFTARIENNYNINLGTNGKEYNTFNISNKEILLNYPNICAKDKNTGNIVYFDNIVDVYNNYYLKIIK